MLKLNNCLKPNKRNIKKIELITSATSLTMTNMLCHVKLKWLSLRKSGLTALILPFRKTREKIFVDWDVMKQICKKNWKITFNVHTFGAYMWCIHARKGKSKHLFMNAKWIKKYWIYPVRTCGIGIKYC